MGKKRVLLSFIYMFFVFLLLFIHLFLFIFVVPELYFTFFDSAGIRSSGTINIGSQVNISEDLCERTHQYEVSRSLENIGDILKCEGYNIELKSIGFKTLYLMGDLDNSKKSLRLEFDVYNLWDTEFIFWPTEKIKLVQNINGTFVECGLSSGLLNAEDENDCGIMKPNSSETCVLYYLLDNYYDPIYLYYLDSDSSVSDKYIEINRKGFFDLW